jgi:enoyl-CoA hydratase/carnithine racemase
VTPYEGDESGLPISGLNDRVSAVNSAPEILFRDDGRVRIVTFNRPDRVNAFTASAYRSLARVLNEADTAGDVSVVLMQGSGRGFSSGVDLDSAAEQDRVLGETFDDLIESLIRFSKPLLAAVHGAAVGFGATILLHCDLVLVGDKARLRYPFTALGTTPEAGSSSLLPRLVGLQRAADLLLTSRWISGAEAAEIGLAARCCPEESLHAEALATARAH